MELNHHRWSVVLPLDQGVDWRRAWPVLAEAKRAGQEIDVEDLLERAGVRGDDGSRHPVTVAELRTISQRAISCAEAAALTAVPLANAEEFRTAAVAAMSEGAIDPLLKPDEGPPEMCAERDALNKAGIVRFGLCSLSRWSWEPGTSTWTKRPIPLLHRPWYGQDAIDTTALEDLRNIQISSLGNEILSRSRLGEAEEGR